ncbi:hypothetical protein HX744_08950 [Pseudonocardia sp. ICBG1122]|nr:hypothetical protein [Pseudonocardia sp. AL041005-10]ALE78239.1 hypothetical protein WY02_07125 [Pseudonocardia sp. AL041005-10]NWJ69004.1 hypothetical protein [Pseudonocardia pini]NWJ70650.1 hypothetical protein [Pseudonocardia pini]
MTGTATGTVVRAVPRDPGAWDRTDRRLGCALVSLARDADAPAGTADAVRGWRRMAGPLRAAQHRPGYGPGPCPDLCLVPVGPADVAALGLLAAALGARTLPGADGGPLRRAAAAAGTTAPALVLELARVHGVLDLDLGADGELLYALAGVRTTGTAAAAAHDAVAARVGTMWAAGRAPYPTRTADDRR